MPDSKNILDVGFGAAIDPKATHGLERVTRSEWLSLGGENSQRAKLTFGVDWNGKWPYANGYFDRIVSYHAVGVWESNAACYAEMLRTLAGGGHAYIYVGKFQPALAEICGLMWQAGFEMCNTRELLESWRIDGKKKKVYGCIG